MNLAADRFLRLPDDSSYDLAAAEPVVWRTLDRLEDAGDERRWRSACATLAGVWHEELPSLVDYGRLPDGVRYEAFVPARPRRWGARGAGALAFLGEIGLGNDAGQGRAMGAHEVRPRRPAAAQPAVGIRLVDRPALAHVVDLLEDARSGRPIVVGYVAERGAGLATWLRAAAREAAARGFVPIGVRALRRWPFLERWVGERHVLLLAGREDARDEGPERALVRLALISPRGHVLLRPARGGEGELRVALEPIDPGALVRAVHLWPPDARTPRAIRAAAERSGGYPGRFLDLLRGYPSASSSARTSRVAEARPEYRVDLPPPSAPDVPRWIERGEAALQMAQRGRHAAARRGLMEAAAALRRRDQPAAAARLEVEVGRLLLAHGAAGDAEAVFRRAHAALEDEDPGAAAAAVAGVGAALLERGSVEAAESLLRAARERRPAERAGLALARCLLWQARYDEAERALTPALQVADPIGRGEALVLLARAAFGRRDLPGAGRAAALALAEVEERRAAAVRAEACEVLVALQGRIADGEAARSYASRGLAVAREARLPLEALAIRMALAGAWHRCRAHVPPRLVHRFARLADGAVPPLWRARLAAVLARIHPIEGARAAFATRVEAFVRATGARGLLEGEDAPGEQAARDTGALIALLAREPDPQRLLDETADWLRVHLDAAAVAILDPAGRSWGAAGRMAPFASASRAVAARQPIPPYLSEHGIEAAAPIEHAGELGGVLAVRWTIDRQPPAAAIPVMVTAASCAGPAVLALRDRATPGRGAAPADGIVGRSAAMARLHDAIGRAGACPFPVLVEGESGAGKELVARALHAASPRRARPFHAVNCAAFQDDLFEAELFGHARGAFTGAYAERPGLFEQADGGTLFLDEVGELTPRAQAKLLRVLQEGEIRRVGENVCRRVDVRVVAASNRPLGDDVKHGRFRQDLLFRIAVIRIAVPALRDRREDVPLLAAHFWSDAAARAGSRATLTRRAVEALVAYDWPGNVRELQNVIAALAVQVPRGRVEAADVDRLLAAAPPEPARTLAEARIAAERAHVAAALARCAWRHAEAARELGISRQGLAKLIRRLALDQGSGPRADS